MRRKKQQSFTDIEYGHRKRRTKRDEFLEAMDAVIPWDEMVLLIAPHYPSGKRGRPPRKAGAKSGPEWGCGIHCHIGKGEHTARTLRNLVNLMTAKEDLISQAFQIDGGRQAQYCRKVNAGFLERLNRAKPTEMATLQRLWYNGRDESYMHYSDTRYHMLNLHATFSKRRKCV